MHIRLLALAAQPLIVIVIVLVILVVIVIVVQMLIAILIARAGVMYGIRQDFSKKVGGVSGAKVFLARSA